MPSVFSLTASVNSVNPNLILHLTVTCNKSIIISMFMNGAVCTYSIKQTVAPSVLFVLYIRLYLCRKMADRKAELERKKAKLEQLRAEKKRAEEEKKRGASGATGTTASAVPAAKDLRIEADDILKELGISTGDVAEPAVRVKQEPSADESKPEAAISEMPVMVRRQTSALGISKITQTSIPPREMVQYSKETQTTGLPEDAEGGRGALVDDVDVLSETAQQPEKPVEPAMMEEVAETPAEKPPPRVLTEDECRQVS